MNIFQQNYKIGSSVHEILSAKDIYEILNTTNI